MQIVDWIRNNEVLLAVMGASGLLLFVASVIAIPVIFAYMPEDYFVRISKGFPKRRPLRQFLNVVKNLFGIVFLLCGLILLLLPGQGLLMIILGISLIDFPGKRKLQIRLIRMPKIRQSVQWIRSKVHHKPLILPE